MSKYFEIVSITGDWKGGNNSQYPKVLLLSPESDRPFVVTEGAGMRSCGASFTLPELFENGVASKFDREESSELFQLLSSAYRSGTSEEVLVRELIERYCKHA